MLNKYFVRTDCDNFSGPPDIKMSPEEGQQEGLEGLLARGLGLGLKGLGPLKP